MTDVKAELKKDLDEQRAIQESFLKAIPENARHTNVVLALHELLRTFIAVPWGDDDRAADAADGRQRGERP